MATVTMASLKSLLGIKSKKKRGWVKGRPRKKTEETALIEADDASENIAKKSRQPKIIGLEKELEWLRVAVENDIPTLLIGETGLGKNYLVWFLSQEYKKPCIRISLNGDVGINELIGRWLARDGSTYWQDGPVITAMRKGYWVVLDELNAALPEILMMLNPLLEVRNDFRGVTLSEKDGEFVRCHPDFRVFACMNPTEGYVGTKEINPALLSRFGMVLRIDYYTPTEEAEILRYHYPSISPAISAIIVDSGNVIRKIRRSNKINYVCGTRDLISWAGIACTNNSAQLGETMTVSILNKVDPSEAMIIVEAVRNVLPSGVKWSNKVKSYDSILTKKILRDAEKLIKEKEVVCHDLETTIVKLNESLRAIRTVDEKV